MNGTSVFVDTNIILYLLAGDRTLAEMLDQKEIYISVISEMELLSYRNLSDAEERTIIDFLETTTIIDLNPSVKSKAITLRKNSRLKLPDSIIAASSLHVEIPLLTADGAFQSVQDLECLIYQR